QLDFILRKLAGAAEQDPTLRERQPWRAAYENDFGWIGQAVVKHYHGDDGDVKLLLGAIVQSVAGVGGEADEGEVGQFLGTATHPTLRRPYRACAYAPMVELLRYLEANRFATYIASGGDRDFMRPATSQLYGIARDRVIGSSYGLSYREEGGSAV